MKLGTETGSIVNHLQSRGVIGQPEPVVGMGATLLGWTDRYPATIVGWNGKILDVQEDHATRTDSNGLSESQSYTYTPNPNAPIRFFRIGRKGLWEEVSRSPASGRWAKTGGMGLRIGERNKYYDPSF